MRNFARVLWIAVVAVGFSFAEANASEHSKESFYVHAPERFTYLVGLDADSWGVFEVKVNLGPIGTFKAQVVSLGGANGYPRWSHSAAFSVDPSSDGVISDERAVSIHFEGPGARRFYNALTRVKPEGHERLKEVKTDQFAVSCLPTVCDVWMTKVYGVQ